jgi:hypothetical protein
MILIINTQLFFWFAEFVEASPSVVVTIWLTAVATLPATIK